MKVTITTKTGKSIEVELTEEQSKDLGLVEKKPRTGYERVGLDDTFFVDNACGQVEIEPEQYCDADDDCYNAANYYSHYDLAVANARADFLLRQLRRYAAENGGIPSKKDFRDEKKAKFFIAFDYKTRTMRTGKSLHSKVHGCIYFLSEEACLASLIEFKEDLLWYFTEYQPMLYDQTQGE